MKLSDLVAYRNLLEQYSLEDMHQSARSQLNAVMHQVVNHGLQFKQFSRDLGQDATAIDSAFVKFGSTIDQIKQHLDVLIEQQYPDMFRDSLRWFDHESIYESDDYILNRQLHIDPVGKELLLGRVLRYTDWRLPGLCFRPAREKWIEHLVPLDPLYLVDNNQQLLEPAVSGFHEQYQRRLRLYTVNDHNSNQNILAQLPVNQFGYVFAYNWFNFKPLSVIEQYLRELWHKIRPGGVILMTFNDCDYAHGVALAEKNFMCFTPGTRIMQIAENIGFDTLDRYRGEGDVAWLEFHKPGIVHSLRGGQTLAKIVKK
jgi:hypothetical protein